MAEKLRLTFRKGDILCMVLVVLLAAALSAWLAVQAMAGEEVTVQIYQDGTLVQECSLEKEQTFSVTGDYTNTISIQNGHVAIISSDCPGGDCVHSGWAGEAGRAIVCLPNRTEVRLVGVTGGVDMVVG